MRAWVHKLFVPASLVVGIVSIAADGLAEKKKPTESYWCTCACQYYKDGKWHWGKDFTFTSRNCTGISGKKWTCYDKAGDSHEGNTVGCGIKDDAKASRDTGTGEQLDVAPGTGAAPGPKPKLPKPVVDPSVAQ